MLRVDPRRIVTVIIVASCAFACLGGDASSSPAAGAAPVSKGSSRADAQTIRGRAAAVDGDGLEIHGRKIRLFGIDAPEAGQLCTRSDGARWHCGSYATVALDRLVAGREVTCRVRDIDRYGRPVAVCTAGGRDLAAELVRQGWALAYRRFSRDYADEEEAARAERAGIWAGRFDEPWQWRERQRRLHAR